MKLLVLSAASVREVLGYQACTDAMREVLAARARGEVFQPLRTVLKPEGAAGLIGLMPSYQGGKHAGYGLKAICVTPGNPAAGLDTHQGIVLFSDPRTGEPLALLNASAVTEIRTAAVSAVATSLLARQDADVLAIVGTGVQARAHVHAIAATRELAEVRVAGSRPAKSAAFAARSRDWPGLPPVIACESVREAVDGAGIVVTATNSAAPVLERDWIADGTHINAVGACLPNIREIDTATMAAAGLYADSKESVLAESGDYLIAAGEGAVGPERIRAEIGDLLAGLAPDAGRRDAQEITIFESLGLAAEDLAAAATAYQAASDRGTGSWVDF
jgi:ornithine cyclodeaminase/alanine dehydrogenase-like protein (mu-crystallin family)